jgi:GTP cyclohydrolase II
MKIEISNEALLPTKWGEFLIQSFKAQNKEHLIIRSKKLDDIVNVRVHSSCISGDVFGSCRCDCSNQLHFALEYIAKNNGMICYLEQEGRGIGLFNKINAYALQDKGMDTLEANIALGFKEDERDFSIVDDILNFYKIKQINLLTNNPDKIKQINTKINKRISIWVGESSYNKSYLNIKKSKLGHLK